METTKTFLKLTPRPNKDNTVIFFTDKEQYYILSLGRQYVNDISQIQNGNTVCLNAICLFSYRVRDMCNLRLSFSVLWLLVSWSNTIKQSEFQSLLESFSSARHFSFRFTFIAPAVYEVAQANAIRPTYQVTIQFWYWVWSYLIESYRTILHFIYFASIRCTVSAKIIF